MQVAKTISQIERIASSYESPLVVEVVAAGGSVTVVLERSVYFRSEKEMAEDFRTVSVAAMTAAALDLDVPVSELSLDVIQEGPGIVQIPWRIEAEWRGSDGGSWSDVVQAGDPVMAVMSAHQSMAASHPDARDEDLQGMGFVEAVVTSVRRDTVFPPVPMVSTDDDLLATISGMAAHGDALSPGVRDRLREALASTTGDSGSRRGEGAGWLASFRCDDPVSGVHDLEVELGEVSAGFDWHGRRSEVETRIETLAREAVGPLVGEASDPEARLRELLSRTALVDLGRKGPLRRHAVEAVWFGRVEEGPWSDVVLAVDEPDALIQACLAMADATPGPGTFQGGDHFRKIAEALTSHKVEAHLSPFDADLALKVADEVVAEVGVRGGVPEALSQACFRFQEARARHEDVLEAPASSPAP